MIAISCLLTTSSLFALTDPQRIEAFLTLGDTLSATRVAAEALRSSPQNSYLWELYIRALAQKGDERGMICAWRQYAEYFASDANCPEVLEMMAWGVISKGAKATAPLVRIFALLAAFLSNDAKGVAILSAHIHDSNTLLRNVALQLAANLRDEPLKNEVLKRLKYENFRETKIEAIRAAGKMKIPQAYPYLLELLDDTNAQLEEREAAMLSLVEISDDVDRAQLMTLCKSERSALRLLGCQLIEHFERTEDLDLLIPLFKDRQSEVKVAALRAIGRTGIAELAGRSVKAWAQDLLKDGNPSVEITAAWLLTMQDPFQGRQLFARWLSHSCRELRLEAVAALVNTGEAGLPLMISKFEAGPELDVRLNLAIGLIGLRECTAEACEVILEMLTSQKQRWMSAHFPLGEIVVPSQIRPSLALPDRPEVINQLTRLELFALLSSLGYPKAERGIIPMLQKRSWGVCGLAAAVLLTEGDEAALQLIEPLLQAEDARIRIQAALILAFWGREEKSLEILQSAYPTAHREMKERILEAMGRIGNREAIPFLVEQLGAANQTISLIAAAALLQCIYH